MATEQPIRPLNGEHTVLHDRLRPENVDASAASTGLTALLVVSLGQLIITPFQRLIFLGSQKNSAIESTLNDYAPVPN